VPIGKGQVRGEKGALDHIHAFKLHTGKKRSIYVLVCRGKTYTRRKTSSTRRGRGLLHLWGAPNCQRSLKVMRFLGKKTERGVELAV